MSIYSWLILKKKIYTHNLSINSPQESIKFAAEFSEKLMVFLDVTTYRKCIEIYSTFIL